MVDGLRPGQDRTVCRNRAHQGHRDGTLVFVEVRYRSGAGFGTATGKVCVASSALMGTVSGSGVATTVRETERKYEAADGVEGLRRARDEHPDAIILDLQMPDLGGLDISPVIALIALQFIRYLVVHYWPPLP